MKSSVSTQRIWQLPRPGAWWGKQRSQVLWGAGLERKWTITGDTLKQHEECTVVLSPHTSKNKSLSLVHLFILMTKEGALRKEPAGGEDHAFPWLKGRAKAGSSQLGGCGHPWPPPSGCVHCWHRGKTELGKVLSDQAAYSTSRKVCRTDFTV